MVCSVICDIPYVTILSAKLENSTQAEISVSVAVFAEHHGTTYEFLLPGWLVLIRVLLGSTLTLLIHVVRQML